MLRMHLGFKQWQCAVEVDDLSRTQFEECVHANITYAFPECKIPCKSKLSELGPVLIGCSPFPRVRQRPGGQSTKLLVLEFDVVQYNFLRPPRAASVEFHKEAERLDQKTGTDVERDVQYPAHVKIKSADQRHDPMTCVFGHLGVVGVCGFGCCIVVVGEQFGVALGLLSQQIEVGLPVQLIGGLAGAHTLERTAD